MSATMLPVSTAGWGDKKDMARPTGTISIDSLEDFYGLHQEPELKLFRLLALSVLNQARVDAITEVRGRKTIYNESLAYPLPSDWLHMQACEDWCRAADVSYSGYRNAVLQACRESQK